MPTDLRNILVTGGTGLFGRSLVRHLVSVGHSVRILSRRDTHSECPRISIFKGNVTSFRDVHAAIQGCSAVFHCAAEKTDTKQMTAVNVAATKLLMDVARDSQIGFFCHLSSVGVTGSTNQAIVDESTPCYPMNVYEETKCAAERIVSQGIDDGKVMILRPTNIFGVETLKPLLENSFHSKMRLFLKGNENAHLVYVEDVAAAANFLLQVAPDRTIETYIVSCDEESGNSHREIQRYLASRIGGVPHPLGVAGPLWVPYYIRLLKHRKANRGDVVYSSKKLRNAGFQFLYGLKAGLTEVVNIWKSARSGP